MAKVLSEILGQQFQVWMQKEKGAEWQPTSSIGNNEEAMERTGETLKKNEGWHAIKVKPLAFSADTKGCDFAAKIEASCPTVMQILASEDNFVTWTKTPLTVEQFDKVVKFYKEFRKAKVRWFDMSSGEGIVIIEEGPLKGANIKVHGSAFGGDVNFGQNTSFQPSNGLDVLVTLVVDTTFVQVDKMKQLESIASSVPTIAEILTANTGKVLWFDERDKYGIVKDEQGNEWYIDVSVFTDRNWVPKSGEKVSFEPNPMPGFKAGTKNVKQAEAGMEAPVAQAAAKGSDDLISISIHKSIQKDSVQNGADPGSLQSVMDQKVEANFSTWEEMLQYLANTYDLPSNKQDYMSFETGRLVYSRNEDENGNALPDTAAQELAEKTGQLYLADYDIYVKYLKVSIPTQIDLVAEGFANYDA